MFFLLSCIITWFSTLLSVERKYDPRTYRDIVHNSLSFVFDFLDLSFDFLSSLCFYCNLFQHLADERHQINEKTRCICAVQRYNNEIA